MINHYNIIRLY